MPTTARFIAARRRITLLVTPAILNIATAAPAWATTGVTAAMLWIGVADSSHVPLGSYGLSLDNGSLTNPTAAPAALCTHWFYSAFLCIIATPIWLVENVVSFKWLAVISQPLDYVGHQMTAMVHSPAVLTAIGLIAAGVIAITFALGKISRAAAQITVAIALALVSAALANKPISDLLGPDGVLSMGRDFGVGISSELSGKSLEGQPAVDAMAASLVDHFARTPTLIWNFGQDLDAAPYNCGQAWSDAIVSGPIDEVKDKVAQSCPDGQALHDYAMSDPTSRRIVAFVAIVFALAVLVVFTYLCAQVVILGLSSVFWAIVGIIALITGWIPGASQTLALKAALDALFSFLGMTGMVALVGLTGNLASAMFSAAGGDLVVAMPLVSLLLVALFVALRKVRKGLVNARERAAGAVRRFTGDQPAATSGPVDPLTRLDPLTAIPNATHRVATLTRHGAGTAAKLGVAIAAPEAAPFLGAGEQLASRLHIKNLRSARRTENTSGHQPTAEPGAHIPSTAYDVAPRGYEAPPADATTTDLPTTYVRSSAPVIPASAPAPPAEGPTHPAPGRRPPPPNPLPTPAAPAPSGPDYAAATPDQPPQLAGPPESRHGHDGRPPSAAEHRQRLAHHRTDPAPAIHPAIAALAHDAPESMPAIYADIRAELIGQR
ncbi:hypothetical protein [Candidatus Mycobacterium methanotrophicum]|uniref:Uncharacterized protein n=1 Tax=Candidatus Mycobacterium methanotrophicum TaxID=2943498 RepID=A0ABY4QU57_9MYCO|nr:hypothetical protein [Candidatus Mycobacterium methanotrophicum]UQX13539.1 hypothetical protein M5I08_25435 [Candidatus Mycobacterium methanotrophicum]